MEVVDFLIPIVLNNKLFWKQEEETVLKTGKLHGIDGSSSKNLLKKTSVIDLQQLDGNCPPLGGME